MTDEARIEEEYYEENEICNSCEEFPCCCNVYPKNNGSKAIKSLKEEHIPMSKNKLFDNSDSWLDDEPWRKW